MELLSEQKRELDIVREKGVQLETAAATSAAAAAATAQRARDHEAKAAAMYGQTEELMKFQFMSMSLSYFSSLNMMKQVRWSCFGQSIFLVVLHADHSLLFISTMLYGWVYASYCSRTLQRNATRCGMEAQETAVMRDA